MKQSFLFLFFISLSSFGLEVGNSVLCGPPFYRQGRVLEIQKDGKVKIDFEGYYDFRTPVFTNDKKVMVGNYENCARLLPETYPTMSTLVRRGNKVYCPSIDADYRNSMYGEVSEVYEQYLIRIFNKEGVFIKDSRLCVKQLAENANIARGIRIGTELNCADFKVTVKERFEKNLMEIEILGRADTGWSLGLAPCSGADCNYTIRKFQTVDHCEITKL